MPTFQTNDGVEIHYRDEGHGRPLFMLPGWTCTTEFWKRNADTLAKTCRVIRMDMRAHGQSEKVPARTPHRPLRHGCPQPDRSPRP